MSSDDFEYKKGVRWNKDIAIVNIKRYCAVQDRSHFEVRTKLLQHQVYGLTLEEIMADLITEGFLNEERFAKSYIRGKFRMKGWGKIKILQGLKLHKISDYSIREGLKEIDDNDYLATVQDLILKRIKGNITTLDSHVERQKVVQFVMTKGFEVDIVLDALKRVQTQS
ncbi:MAG: regulatory protein RecX [Saprospiraceae bacterium]